MPLLMRWVSRRTAHIPVPVAMAMGFVFEGLSYIFRLYPVRIPQTGRPPFSRKTVKWTAGSRLYVDISKARKELGYTPHYSLQGGMRETAPGTADIAICVSKKERWESNMKVLLIQSYLGSSGTDGVVYPLGLAYIGAAAESAGHKVRLITPML